MADVVQITDVAQRALDRLPGHLRTADSLKKIIQLLIAPMQDLENDLWDMHSLRLFSGTGDRLDQVGDILNTPRKTNEADSDYKIRLQGVAQQLASSGEAETLITAYIALINEVALAADILLQEAYPATVILHGEIDRTAEVAGTFALGDSEGLAGEATDGGLADTLTDTSAGAGTLFSLNPLTSVEEADIVAAMSTIKAGGVALLLELIDITFDSNTFQLGDAADADGSGNMPVEDDGLGTTASDVGGQLTDLLGT